MTASSQPYLTPLELSRLQRLQALVVTFQNSIASLPAKEASNTHNEQFNQLRLEAKAILKEPSFDKEVPRAVTEDILAERLQKVVIPRLYLIITAGVILVLLGLGVNSIVLDELFVNILGCLVSSTGMLLVVGSLAVFGASRSPRRLTNYGDLYQACEALLYQINHTLNIATSDSERRPPAELPEIPSVVELRLDSLHQQAADWQQKLTQLETQRVTLGTDAPSALNVNIEFVQRELHRVNQEIDVLDGKDVRLSGEHEAASPALPVAQTETPPTVGETPSKKIKRASAHTLGMPVSSVEEEPASETRLDNEA